MDANNSLSHRILFLSFIIIFQSCTVYRSNPVSIEEAAKTDVKLKVFTSEGQKLKLKRIEKKNDDFFGYAKPSSSTGKILQEKVNDFERSGRFGVFKLQPSDIKEVYPQNKPITTLVNVGTVVLSLITLLYIVAAAIFLSSWGGSF